MPDYGLVLEFGIFPSPDAARPTRSSRWPSSLTSSGSTT